jgi:6,7-dimethyl-8-ribityllumazine synthase
VFKAGVVGIKLASANGGDGIRVAGVVVEGGLRVVEHRAHEHREGVRNLSGYTSCSIVAGNGREGSQAAARLGGDAWVASGGVSGVRELHWS